jgi:hypothetical protein
MPFLKLERAPAGVSCSDFLTSAILFDAHGSIAVISFPSQIISTENKGQKIGI